MYSVLPPTVNEAGVCPYWFLQMQCSSMRTHDPRSCPYLHPEFIDYDVSEMDEADQWCTEDGPEIIRGQLQWMVDTWPERSGVCGALSAIKDL